MDKQINWYIKYESFKQIIIVSTITFFLALSAKAEKECFEKVSRSIFKFNNELDRMVIGPIAKGYNKLPAPIKNGAGNFTSNIGTLLSIPNRLIQKDLTGAADSLGSFMINSTFGVLGLADVASSYGLKDTKEDLSQSLGVYGVKNGCYYVLHFESNNSRDSVAMIGDTYLDPFATMTEQRVLSEKGKKVNISG